MKIRTVLDNWQEWLFLGYLFLLPLSGKSISDQESFWVYTPAFIFVLGWVVFSKTKKRWLTAIALLAEMVLIILYAISTFYSLNIGISYYQFFNFLTVCLLLNVSGFYLKKEDRLLKTIVFFSILYSLVFLASKFGIVPTKIGVSEDSFILQVWGHSYLADLLILPVLILIYKIDEENWRSLVLLFFFSGILMLTNSRSAILATIVGTLFLVFSSRNFTKIKLGLVLLLIFFLGSMFYRITYYGITQKSIDGSRLEYWQEAVKGFKKSPIIGNGPLTFSDFNRMYRPSKISNANYPHNSLLQFLCENGVLFTVIFFGAYLFGTSYQYKRNKLFFSLSLAMLVNSLMDPSWANIGIFSLSLILTFWKSPKLWSDRKNQAMAIMVITGGVFLGLYSISRIMSDFFLNKGDYQRSLRANPFNLYACTYPGNDWRWCTKKWFPNKVFTYSLEVGHEDLPFNEDAYYKLFELEPKDGFYFYQKLLEYYLETEQPNKVKSLSELMMKNINIDDWTTVETMPMAKMLYYQAKTEWDQGKRESALESLEFAARLSHRWSTFYVELAHAYKANGNINEARRVLKDECSKNADSVPDCEDYLEILDTDTTLPWSKEMMEAIDNISG